MVKYEEQLYLPVKRYFERKGFQIKGEILDCDIVGIKGDTMLIVELKKSFNLKLVYQALERQKITDFVYVAIPRPKNFKKKEVRLMKELLNRLNIGLVVVSFGEKRTLVQTVCDPIYDKEENNKNFRKKAVIDEFNQRTGDYNNGGTNQRKILTAYREKSIEIACFLEILEKSTGAELKKIGCDKNATTIMRNNFYGWFSKLKTGVYFLGEKGKNYLDGDEFAEIIYFYRKEAKERCLKYQEMKI